MGQGTQTGKRQGRCRNRNEHDSNLTTEAGRGRRFRMCFFTDEQEEFLGRNEDTFGWRKGNRPGRGMGRLNRR
jgi:hypothetical protein